MPPKKIKVVYRKLGREKIYGQAHHEDSIIEIDARIKGKKELEIITHETLHILFPEIEEEEIEEKAIILIKLLWKLGYRKVDNTNNEPLQDGTK